MVILALCSVRGIGTRRVGVSSSRVAGGTIWSKLVNGLLLCVDVGETEEFPEKEDSEAFDIGRGCDSKGLA